MKRCTWTSPAVTCGDLQSLTKTQPVYQYVGEYRLEAWRRWHELPPKLEYLRNQATDHFLFFWRTITHWYTNFRFYPNFINSRCARSSLSGSHIKKKRVCATTSTVLRIYPRQGQNVSQVEVRKATSVWFLWATSTIYHDTQVRLLCSLAKTRPKHSVRVWSQAYIEICTQLQEYCSPIRLQKAQLPNSDIHCNSLCTVRCRWVVKNSLLHTDTERVWEAARIAARELGYTDLKQEQLRVVEAFVHGHDVFAVLPTGYGKSLCYACLPIVFDQLLELQLTVPL